ncbi:MAG: hypothetical protein ACRERD_07895, partial [Candidatus Binatia bacterium]
MKSAIIGKCGAVMLFLIFVAHCREEGLHRRINTVPTHVGNSPSSVFYWQSIEHCALQLMRITHRALQL